MNNSLLNEFYPQISQKGYTLREVSKPDTSKTFPDLFDSYEEYQDALHDFLNGIWIMSVLHHESLYETCFDECFEEFRVSNKLTEQQMSDLCSASVGTLDAIEQSAWKKFQDLCQ